MAGQVKVVVLENDYAKQCGLGLPFSLSYELQLKELSLGSVLWSARASGGGFSISLFWPSGSPEKKKPKRKRRHRTRSLKASEKNTNNNSIVPFLSSQGPTGDNEERLSPARGNSYVGDIASVHGVAAARPPNPKHQSEPESSIKANEIYHDHNMDNSEHHVKSHSMHEDSLMTVLAVRTALSTFLSVI